MTMTPYERAYEMLRKHPGTGGSCALAKMILSLYNDENGFAFRECVDGRDSEIVQVCLDMAAYYARHGEDEALRIVGGKVCKFYPHILDIGYAGYLAKCEAAK
jgi:hypothetical protein